MIGLAQTMTVPLLCCKCDTSFCMGQQIKLCPFYAKEKKLYFLHVAQCPAQQIEWKHMGSAAILSVHQI